MRFENGVPGLTKREVSEILNKVIDEGTQGIAIHGSFARGEGTGISDIDLLKIKKKIMSYKNESYVIGGRLVSCAMYTHGRFIKEMETPDKAIWAVPSLRESIVLFDPEGILEDLKDRAEKFLWEPLKEKALEYSGTEISEYCEEVFKIAAAIEDGNESSAYNATTSLVIGMTRVVLVSRGEMVRTENDFYSLAQVAMGRDSRWTRLFRKAAGLEPSVGIPWKERATAAVDLYLETEKLVDYRVDNDHEAMIGMAKRIIDEYLPDTYK